LLENIEALSLPFVQESSEELRLALEQIPADYALVLRMRFLDEMPQKRISAFLGVPVSTVKWRVHQGKKLLREELTKIRGK
jgi:RNA polymerase sigma-70 factor, ECF subfamily